MNKEVLTRAMFDVLEAAEHNEKVYGLGSGVSTGGRIRKRDADRCVCEGLLRVDMLVVMDGDFAKEPWRERPGYVLTDLGKATLAEARKDLGEDGYPMCCRRRRKSDLSWSQRRLLLAMEPGRIYTRVTDPCRMIRSCTIRVLRRQGLIERVIGTVEWSYRLTPAGVAVRDSLRTVSGADDGVAE